MRQRLRPIIWIIILYGEMGIRSIYVLNWIYIYLNIKKGQV